MSLQKTSFLAEIQAQNRICIPIQTYKFLQLKQGQRVLISVESQGKKEQDVVVIQVQNRFIIREKIMQVMKLDIGKTVRATIEVI